MRLAIWIVLMGLVACSQAREGRDSRNDGLIDEAVSANDWARVERLSAPGAEAIRAVIASYGRRLARARAAYAEFNGEQELRECLDIAVAMALQADTALTLSFAEPGRRLAPETVEAYFRLFPSELDRISRSTVCGSSPLAVTRVFLPDVEPLLRENADLRTPRFRRALMDYYAAVERYSKSPSQRQALERGRFAVNRLIPGE